MLSKIILHIKELKDIPVTGLDWKEFILRRVRDLWDQLEDLGMTIILSNIYNIILEGPFFLV